MTIKCKHSFNVCSMFSYSFYHMVGTRETMECEVGQRVRLTGLIKSQNYWNEENKLRQKVIIKASALELLPYDDKQLDRNHVELVAKISSDISNTRDYSKFQISTQHTPR